MTPTIPKENQPSLPRKFMITGSANGIGLALARRALIAGDRVLATYRPEGDPSRLHALSREYPETLALTPLDVTSDVSVRGAVESAGRLGFHRIDVIVNNAGTLIEPPHPLSDILMERLFYEFDVNVFGAVRVTRAFLPLLEGSPRPCVAQISSIQGSLAQCARPDLYGYRMSKCALNMFNRVLSHELRPQGITCLSVHPGSVKTAMGRGANAISPDDAAIPLYELLNSVTIERTGAFVGPTGEDICW